MIGPAEIAVATPLPARGFAARLTERLRDWRQRRRWISEMADAATLGRLDDTLKDVGITGAELGMLIEAPADAGTQFEILSKATRIDLHDFGPAVLREAMWVCTRCASRAPCQHWLRTGYGGTALTCAVRTPRCCAAEAAAHPARRSARSGRTARANRSIRAGRSSRGATDRILSSMRATPRCAMLGATGQP